LLVQVQLRSESGRTIYRRGRVARFLDRQAGEEPQFDDLDGCRIFGFEPAQCVVKEKEVVGRFENPVSRVQINSPPPAAVPGEDLPPGGVNQNPTHRFGGGGEKMPATVKPLVPDESQVGLVNEGSGIEGISRSFGCHARDRELPQLVVNEREQVGCGSAVASREGVKKAGRVGHVFECTGYERGEAQEIR
jgi:hypothetical protein